MNVILRLLIAAVVVAMIAAAAGLVIADSRFGGAPATADFLFTEESDGDGADIVPSRSDLDGRDYTMAEHLQGL